MDYGSEDKIDEIGPFEWLTSFSSLSKLLDPTYLFPTTSSGQKNLRVLHIGCGSSSLGEHLIRYYREYSLVVNADCDEETLLGMKQRWNKLLKNWESNGETITSQSLWMKFDFNNIAILDNKDELNGGCSDHSHSRYNHENQNNVCLDGEFFKLKNNYFDLVLDKGTFDCALCSDDATSGLIVNVYQSLKANGGVYFIVSFHHVDFMMHLLQNCPDVDWDVEHDVVSREGDSPSYIESIDATFQIPKQILELDQESESVRKEVVNFHTPWSSSVNGTFQPSEEYNKFVNVFICRRKKNRDNSQGVEILDREKIRKHIHECNDLHFKENNPMVTPARKDQIKDSFLERIKLGQEEKDDYDTTNLSLSNCDDETVLKNSVLSLKSCYEILFTVDEKEHFTFEYFMEDFVAFSEEHVSLCDGDGMTYDTAILFLETMQ
jgi:hypothetical protein